MKKLISVIIPCYNENHILNETIKRAVNQKYENKEIIIVADNPTKDVEKIIKKWYKKVKIIKNSHNNWGLTGSLNNGIKESKGEIIVTLLADCLPKNDKWLISLVKNFKDHNVVAVASKVKNDDKTFDKFDPLVKDIMHDRQKVYSPGLDEKGCAYRKNTLEEVGLFDSKHFKTAGEDFDMYYKMTKEGKVISGNEPYVIHVHPLDLQKIYNRSASYSRGSGVLFRIYGYKFFTFKSILKNLFPLWGIAKGIKTPANYSNQKLKLILIYIKLNWIYIINFTKSFILKKQ
tara:strand:- start:1169 stop:2035 length:867 start_codon:yes stop_codon:yes gene_type:complete